MTKPEKNKRLISKFYEALQSEPDDNLEIKQKWEIERNLSILDENWEETFKEGHKMFSSVYWKEFEWKLKTRYFLFQIIVKYERNVGGAVVELETTHIYFGIGLKL